MADAALARREARRRRILENSHNRLQLISNITNDECCKESPVKNVKTSIIEENNEIPAKKTERTVTRDIVNNGMTNNEPVSFDVLSNDNSEDDFFGDQVTTNDSAGFAFPKPGPDSSDSTLLEKLSTYKYDLVLLSLMVQLLYCMSVISFDDTYFFLPLLLYTTTKLIFFPKQEHSKYANILMLLNGMTSQQTMKIMTVLQWFSIAMQDACIYLFTTICVQSIANIFSSVISLPLPVIKP